MSPLATYGVRSPLATLHAKWQERCCEIGFSATREYLTPQFLPGPQIEQRRVLDDFPRLLVRDPHELIGPVADDAPGVSIPGQVLDVHRRVLLGLPVGEHRDDL